MIRNLIKNWGFDLAIFERIVIFSISLWTFFHPNTPRIQEKGLVFRQIIFILFIFILPFLAWKRKMSLKDFPFKTDALILTPIFFDTVGNFATGFILSYYRWSYFDKIAHFWGSAVFTFLAFIIIIAYFYRRKINKYSLIYVFILSLIIGIVLEGLWEIWEYYQDIYYGTILVGGWKDTLGDIFFGFWGSFSASFLGVIWYNQLKQEIKKKYFLNFSQLIFGR